MGRARPRQRQRCRSEAINAATPDSSVSALRGRMNVSGLSVTSPVKQQRGEVKHKPGSTVTGQSLCVDALLVVLFVVPAVPGKAKI